jgi:integrase
MFRRYQCGSLLKRGKKGRQMWYGVFREDVPQLDGGIARKQRFVRLGPVSEYPNRSMAEELLRQKMNAKPSPRIKFPELVDRWRETIVPTIRESTAIYYNKILDIHVLPYFAGYEVGRIEKYDVQKFLAAKAEQGFCKNTIRGMRISSGRVLAWAVENKWIPENPCRGVKLPEAGTKVERTILKPEQVLAIVNELEEPYATFVLFLAITGLRVGEAVGVRWSDMEGTALHVQRRIYEGKAGEVKTKKSRRTLPLPEELIDRMKALPSGAYVFRTRAGSPMNPKNAAHRHLRPACENSGFTWAVGMTFGTPSQQSC